MGSLALNAPSQGPSRPAPHGILPLQACAQSSPAPSWRPPRAPPCQAHDPESVLKCRSSPLTLWRRSHRSLSALGQETKTAGIGARPVLRRPVLLLSSRSPQMRVFTLLWSMETPICRSSKLVPPWRAWEARCPVDECYCSKTST